MEQKIKILNLIKAKQFESAFKILNKNFNTNCKDFYYYKALILCGKGKFYDAINCFNLSRELGLNNYLLYYNLGVSHMECKEYTSAIKYYNLSMSLNKYYIKNYINTAYIYIRYRDYKSAYRIIKLGLALTSDKELGKIEGNLFKIVNSP